MRERKGIHTFRIFSFGSRESGLVSVCAVCCPGVLVDQQGKFHQGCIVQRQGLVYTMHWDGLQEASLLSTDLGTDRVDRVVEFDES